MSDRFFFRVWITLLVIVIIGGYAISSSRKIFVQYNIADLNKDGKVNMLDVSIFSKEWGKQGSNLVYVDDVQTLPVYCPNDMNVIEFKQVLK